MKALVFAAGLGTRLKPLTDTVPKALVEVGGKPALEHVMRKIIAAGVTDITVNVHHHAGKVREFLASRHWGDVTVRVSDESEQLLDTGGGLLAAQELLGCCEPILLHNADILTDFPLEEMIECHSASGADCTLLTSERSSSRRILFDSDGRMRGWTNTSTGQVRPEGLDATGLTPCSFGGVHIVEPVLFPMLADYAEEAGRVFSIMPFYIDKCNNLNIRSYSPSAAYRWFDIGRPETLDTCRKTFV